jgi:hypothetical protein
VKEKKRKKEVQDDALAKQNKKKSFKFIEASDN